MPEAEPTWRLRPVGDAALLIELGRADPAATAQARSLAAIILAAHWPGVYDIVPAYCTVLVRFNPHETTSRTIQQRIAALKPTLDSRPDASSHIVEIPVCYGGVYGPDLKDVVAHTGLSQEEVIAQHAGAAYRVEFLGFSPGFAYLSGLPASLATPRLPSPRQQVPAGSVAIGGAQTGFYPLASPGGWRLIGRTPVVPFDPSRPETIQYGPGDTLRFLPISEARFLELQAGATGQAPGSTEGAAQRAKNARAASGERDGGVEPCAPTDDGRAGGLLVRRAGPLATVQDGGRMGLAGLGYATAGALDGEAMQIANILVGNPEDAAVLELTLDGGEFEAIGDLVIAVTGADLSPSRDGEPLPGWQASTLRHGMQLRFGRQRDGARAYLAIAGGVNTPPLHGSRATDLLAGLGGYQGRALRTGDVIPIGLPSGRGALPPIKQEPDGGYSLDPRSVPVYGKEIMLRIMWGPQDQWFDEGARAAFLAGPFLASARSDRTGLRLEGPAILPKERRDLASEGAVPGAIQIPPDGQPIILLADSRGVGGYPKIAVIISADLHLTAQIVAGARLRFQAVELPEAERSEKEQRQRLQNLPLRPAPEVAVRCLFDTFPGPQGAERCPRNMACLIARRCLRLT